MFRAVTKRSEMHPNIKKRTKTRVWILMVWIGCVCCEKLQRDIVAGTFVLIAPVRPILHRVSRSIEIVPNAPQHYEMHQNISLRSIGVDHVRMLRKNPMRLRGTNFCINCTSSACFVSSFVQ